MIILFLFKSYYLEPAYHKILTLPYVIQYMHAKKVARIRARNPLIHIKLVQSLACGIPDSCYKSFVFNSVQTRGSRKDKREWQESYKKISSFDYVKMT